MKDKTPWLGSAQAKIREFLYDTQMDEAEHMAELMGCTPISDDLYDRELDESEARIDKIEPIIPVIYAFVTVLSDAIIRHELDHDDDKSYTKQKISMMKTIIMSTSFPAVVATLSQLVDLGLVQVTATKKKRRFKLW